MVVQTMTWPHLRGCDAPRFHRGVSHIWAWLCGCFSSRIGEYNQEWIPGEGAGVMHKTHAPPKNPF